MLKLSNYVSDPFTISNGTPQGSPLSPILSALYTASLLQLANNWKFQDLTLYIDNGTIYATSTTTRLVITRFKEVLAWLGNNGLLANPAKTKLMVFSKSCQPYLTGPKI